MDTECTEERYEIQKCDPGFVYRPAQPVYRPCGDRRPPGNGPCEEYRTMQGTAASRCGSLPGRIGKPGKKNSLGSDCSPQIKRPAGQHRQPGSQRRGLGVAGNAEL